MPKDNLKLTCEKGQTYFSAKRMFPEPANEHWNLLEKWLESLMIEGIDGFMPRSIIAKTESGIEQEWEEMSLDEDKNSNANDGNGATNGASTGTKGEKEYEKEKARDDYGEVGNKLDGVTASIQIVQDKLSKQDGQMSEMMSLI
ncbi:uncharacterized protein [Venturia canescens]|uniref:uncharacterized protein n=1 Tax=Venturia canescens TaxID=32260 RepID=UPI001C9C82C3|nr:uncharacterized protein LOC122408438 [Venturia canescens]